MAITKSVANKLITKQLYEIFEDDYKMEPRSTYFGDGNEPPTLVLANGENFTKSNRPSFKVKQSMKVGFNDTRGWVGSNAK